MILDVIDHCADSSRELVIRRERPQTPLRLALGRRRGMSLLHIRAVDGLPPVINDEKLEAVGSRISREIMCGQVSDADFVHIRMKDIPRAES
ncbi:MAG: hypothetical protein RBG13Loki_0916 [Promethearchaeota archaeon CR_4]|nr:MAG: hypothetical protein RBG13Loki_0916 [Candidatus Lokiarchaeota archaeon CR_4]